ncbi:MAG: hypothetical protein RLZZ155_944 [Bacteroidota bacterium]|jgi:hypothetical protein
MIRRKAALVLFIIVHSFVSGQNMNDAGMWNAFSVSSDVSDLTPWKDPKILKDLRIYFNPEIRIDENFSRLNNFFADLGTEKKWSKFLSTSVEYRIGGRREEDWYNLRRRWSYGAQLSFPFHDFKFSATTRCQIARSASSDIDLTSTWRQKFGIEYSKWDNFSIQMSHELFFLPITLENTNWRSQFVLKYKLDKSKALSIGYLVQRDLTNADMDFVILTGYKWEFNKKKEKSTPAVQ